ncbi:hypothetical protein Hypma_000932 [Hypsizygus marmoreus]|uniref:Uncharacterized protein n=1 Tax=Hypsizygus marmoreus TaxID=39966 RepID=A0A369JCB3_HYPMA|nr:hypothetical protein Hypma_000932 [Hypsizygus marmoreus]
MGYNFEGLPSFSGNDFSSNTSGAHQARPNPLLTSSQTSSAQSLLPEPESISTPLLAHLPLFPESQAPANGFSLQSTYGASIPTQSMVLRSPMSSTSSLTSYSLGELMANPNVAKVVHALQQTHSKVQELTTKYEMLEHSHHALEHSHHALEQTHQALEDSHKSLTQSQATLMETHSLVLQQTFSLQSKVELMPWNGARLSNSGTSLSPTDSISNIHSHSESPAPSTPSIINQPATRPPHYPRSVLWHLSDCKDDIATQTSESNKSRPRMEKCIRHADGQTISSAEYQAIKNTARMVKHDLLHLPVIKDAKLVPGLKKYYLEYYRPQWNQAIARLESQQPLLSLCASHWKAEHVMSTALRSDSRARTISTPIAPSAPIAASNIDSDAQNGSEDDDDAGSYIGHVDPRPASRQSKKRPDPPSPPKAPKVKKSRSGSKSAGSKSALRARGESSATAKRPGKDSRKRKDQDCDNSQNANDASSTVGSIAPESTITSKSDTMAIPTVPNAPTGSTNGLEVDMVSAVNASDVTSHPKPGYVDVGFIHVNASYKFSRNYPNLPFAIDLLNAMEANPDFKHGPSSAEVLAFLARISDADPNAPDLEEDDDNANWGHYQLQGGSMTSSTVLTSWTAIGSTETACKLLAAVIKTSKVAHHICFLRKTSATSYLADSYLETLVDILWRRWREAGGPIDKGKSVPRNPETTPPTSSTAFPAPHSQQPASPASFQVPQDAIPPLSPQYTGSPAATTLVQTQPSTSELAGGVTATMDSEVAAALKPLTKESLKKFIKEKVRANATKDELVTMILKLPQPEQPSLAVISELVQAQKLARKGKA